jgi:hypothetical protein
MYLAAIADAQPQGAHNPPQVIFSPAALLET